MQLGDRLLIAEVLTGPDAKAWVRLLVRKCETLSEPSVKKLPFISSGPEITRASETIIRGKGERLLWSDESARTIVASKFLNYP